jgi:hypothetical protein
MVAIFIKHGCLLGDTAVQRYKDSDGGVFYLTKLSVDKIIYR